MSEPQHVSPYVQEALAIGDGNLCQVQYEFIEEVFELCFGEDGINRGFSMDEALAKIREFSDKALAFAEGRTIQPTFTVGEDGEPMI